MGKLGKHGQKESETDNERLRQRMIGRDRESERKRESKHHTNKPEKNESQNSIEENSNIKRQHLEIPISIIAILYICFEYAKLP